MTDGRLQQAIREASTWYVRLNADPVSPRTQDRWRQWLAADATHARAWQRVTDVQATFSRVPGALAQPALQAAGKVHRRTILRGMVGIGIVVSSAGIGYRLLPWALPGVDVRTAVGERRRLVLADGSIVHLNTDTAIDVRFGPAERRLVLHRGEIIVTTHPDGVAVPRPFLVETQQASVLALGTQFSVQTSAQVTQVGVQQAAVEVWSHQAPAHRMRVSSGQQTRVAEGRVQAPQLLDRTATAWRDGSLIAIDQPLGELVMALSRYRRGWLRCDPAVAHRRVSGTFPIDDTDLALAALAQGFGLRIVRRSAYWVTVTGA
jgi:transmembrane sensor